MNDLRSEETILFNHPVEGVGLLQVNRPDARNALNWDAQKRFANVITVVAQDCHLRVLIITGSGNQAFVSGGDLKELSDSSDGEAGIRLNQIMGQAPSQISQLAIPVIAAMKKLIYAAEELDLADLNALERSLFLDLWAAPDHLEALAAFNTKRKPIFNRFD